MVKMVFTKEDLDVKSRQQLYSIINQLNITVDKLESEKKLLKIILNNFVKYYKYFDKISETFLSEEVLDAKNEIKQWMASNGVESQISGKSWISLCLYL